MAGRVVECFYTLSSPWMYLAAPQLNDIVARHRVRLVLRPYDFRLVIAHTGGVALRTRPEARQDYHALELDRWRQHLGLALTLRPKYYPPADQRPAGRMVMAAQTFGLDAMRLSHAILRALWVEQRDIADPRTRIAIAEAERMPGAELQGEEESAPVLAEWDRNNKDAIARGVFGAPTFFCDDLWLWGQDRLFFLDEYLSGKAVQSGPSAIIRKERAS